MCNEVFADVQCISRKIAANRFDAHPQHPSSPGCGLVPVVIDDSARRRWIVCTDLMIGMVTSAIVVVGVIVKFESDSPNIFRNGKMCVKLSVTLNQQANSAKL